MASFTLTRPEVFPNGATVKAYPTTNWPNGVVNQAAAPIGTETNSQTVSSGSVTFTGLTDGVSYVAHSQVGGVERYIGFVPGANTPGSAPDTGSVVTASLADDAVTGAKIATISDEGVVISHTDGLTLSGNGGKDTLNLSNGAANVGLTIGSANLYNSAADTLKTDDTFWAVGAIVGQDWIYANASTAAQVLLGSQGPSGEAGIKLGNATQATIYKSVASGVTVGATGQKVGFYGTAAISQQTGVAVSAAGIHAALVALGLVTA